MMIERYIKRVFYTFVSSNRLAAKQQVLINLIRLNYTVLL